MTDEEKRKWELELEALRAQTSLQLKQAQTGFWKVGLACVAVTAAVVQAINLIFG